MAHFHSNALIGASGGGGAEPPGNRSIRFNDGDSAYLNRTPSSASNRRTWTWSAWLKRGALGIHQYLFSAGTASNYFALSFDNNDKWQVDSYGGGANAFYMHTGDTRFRDTSAWYHLVAVLDTTESTGTDRFKLYINGSRVTLTVGTNVPPSNADQLVNSTIEHRIGRIVYGGTTNYFDGYLTDIHFVDGSALLPTAFGAFDSNGVWQKGTYSGSYGTNGFHIFDFANEAEIGGDSSGNGNDYTPNNISDTDGAGLDLLLDFPKNGSETDSGAGGEVSGNYATFLTNSLVNRACTFSNGNLDVVIAQGFGGQNNDGIRAISNIGMTSGKFYFEHVITGGSKARSNVGVINDITNTGFGGNHWIGSRGTDYIVWSFNGTKYNGGTQSSYGVSWTTGDIIGCAFDADAGNLYVYKNGTVMNSGTPAFTGLTNGPYYFICAENNSNITVNFGQRPFEHNAPSGYKCLNTANLPTPTIADGRDNFDAKLWTGNSSDQRAITGYQFSPDLVWIKRRNASYAHPVMDTVRGLNNGHARVLYISQNNAEDSGSTSSIRSFNSDGFNLGTDGGVNYNGSTYVGWAWDAGSSTGSNNDGSINSNVRANQSAGISIVTYTGNNTSGATVGHGLNAAPDFIAIKRRSGTENWLTYNRGIGATKAVFWNLTDATHSNAAWFNNTNPSSSVFTLGSGNNVNNGNGDTYVAYCFAPVEGFSSFGTYVGNGTTDGPFIHTGFKPAFFMTKHTQTSGYDWAVNDAVRNTGNPASNALFPSSTAAEDSTRHVDLLGNGVKVRNSSPIYNQSGITYVYVAFASNPFQANGGLAR